MDSTISEFIEEIIEVCKRRGFSIGHEDGHGAFQIVPFEDFYSDWLRQAWRDPHLQADNTASSSAE